MASVWETRHEQAYEVLGDYDAFSYEVLFQLAKSGISLRDLAFADHVCYRTTSLENYAEMQQRIGQFATLLGETEVNGRPISTFRLHEPLYTTVWRVDAVELPAPKPGSEYTEGLEHMEFVLFDDLPTFMKRYSHLDFETRAIDRGINPELGLRLGEVSVKFHMLSLPTAVYLEDKLNIRTVADEM